MTRPTASEQPRPASTSNSTCASTAYDRLEADILMGALKPGAKLRLKDLIDRYDTGNSPLREALNRLSAKGMVVREENRGFRVPPAKREELQELTRTRCWLEEIGLRESIANGDPAWEERIVLAFHRLRRAAKSETPRGEGLYPKRVWEAHHQDFHIALLSACGSDILLKYCAELHQRTFRYTNLAGVIEYGGEHELDEHQALQDAVLNRDTDLAVELLHRHHDGASRILIERGCFD